MERSHLFFMICQITISMALMTLVFGNGIFYHEACNYDGGDCCFEIKGVNYWISKPKGESTAFFRLPDYKDCSGRNI